MADEVTKPRPLGEEEVQDIQITLKSEANPMSVRELRVCFLISLAAIHSHSFAYRLIDSFEALEAITITPG